MCKFIFFGKERQSNGHTSKSIYIFTHKRFFSFFKKHRVRLIISDGLKKVKYKSKHTVNKLKTHLCVHSLPNWHETLWLFTPGELYFSCLKQVLIKVWGIFCCVQLNTSLPKEAALRFIQSFTCLVNVLLSQSYCDGVSLWRRPNLHTLHSIRQ